MEDEALGHYQALIRFDTSATERAEAEYLKRLFDQHGIPAQILAKDPERPNVVARLKGSGRKRPLLLLGHLDTVTVDASKWKFPPFSATRDGGFVYGRGAIDDKDNLAAAVMTMLLLKRQNVPLDRDVILLAESGEEGASNLGMGFMVGEHYPLIDAEYCIAEGGDTIRERGEVRYATVQVTEKVVRGVELTAQGHLGSRLGAAHLERDRAPGQRRRQVHHLAARREDRRDHRPLLPPAGDAGLAREGHGTTATSISPDPKVASAAADWLFAARAAPCVDGAHVGLAEHLHRWLPLQRDPVGGQGPARRADGAGRGRRGAAGADPKGDQRPGGGRAVRRRRWRQRPPAPATRLDSELFTTVEAAVRPSTRCPRCRR